MADLPVLFDPATPEAAELRALVDARLGDPSVFLADWYEAWLGSHTTETRARYARDNATFASWLGAETAGQALTALLAAGQGRTNQALTEYRTWLVTANRYKPAVVNRHLSAVRSALKTARLFGLVPWAPDVKGVRAKRLVEMPGELDIDRITRLFAAAAGERPTQVRDRAILWLLWGLGLRRFEATGLDLEHYDRPNNRVYVLPKGGTERIGLELPREASDALKAWVKVRGRRRGALFGNQDRGGKRRIVRTLDPETGAIVESRSDRLTDRSLHEMVAHYGRRAGIYARPHLIRRAAINYVLDLTGDLRIAQAFARHENAATTSVYLTVRREEAAKAAQAIASALEARLESPAQPDATAD